MTFYVGQKVVRVGGEALDPLTTYPPLHKPVTVSNVYLTPINYLAIEIAEYPAPETKEFFAGFAAKYFRPVVERKTSIKVFEEILRNTKAPVTDDAMHASLDRGAS